MARREQGTGSVYETRCACAGCKANPDEAKHSSRWVGEVRIAGKRRRVSGKTRAEASRKLRELTAKRDTGQRIADRSATVATAIAEFLDRDIPNRNLAPKTLELYQWTAAMIVDEIGTIRLADLDVDAVEAMLDRLATRNENPLSRSSLTKVRGTLQRAIAFAERRGKAIRNPALAATITPHAARSQPRQALSPEDARTLLDALRDERNGLMFALSLRIGLRPGEAAALYWRDVAGGVVNVTRGLRRIGARPVIVDEVKTSGSRRTIELPDDLIEWLSEHERHQKAERLAAETWADDRLVFATMAGAVIDPTHERRHLARVCASITKRRREADPDAEQFPVIRPNELRHSCASLLSDAGVPLELIADLLGHESTDMLDRTYRHRLRPVVDVAARATWAQTG